MCTVCSCSFSRLYRGIGPLFVLEAPKRAMKFG